MEDNYADFEVLDHLYDAQITTEDGTVFPVHRFLLAMRSRYFHKLICIDGWEDTNIPVLNIRGSIMKIILDYLNTGNNNVIENHCVPDILLASFFLGMEDLLQTCRAIADKIILTTRNCIPLFLSAIDTDDCDFVNTCVRYLIVHFERVLLDPNSRFYDIPIELFKKLLFSDSLNISNEHQVWSAIEFWVGRDPETRKIHIIDLLPSVRFQTGSDNLAVDVLNHPYVQENPHANNIKDIIIHRSLSFQHRTPKEIFFVIKYFTDSSDNSEGVKVFMTYDEVMDFWRNIGTQGDFSPNVILHVCGSKIALFLTTMNNEAFMFDVMSKVWTPLNPPTALSRVDNVVKLGRDIYAVCGFIDEDLEDPTEVWRYNIDTGVWELIAQRNGILLSQAVAFDSKICVIGGSILSGTLVAVSYNPSTETWTAFSPPNICRTGFAFVVYRRQLYVLGEEEIGGGSQSVEVYDAQRQMWKEVESLPFAYEYPRAVVIKDILYVYCADQGSRHPPVRWDESNQHWQVVEASSPYFDFHQYQFCSINDDEVMIEMRSENTDPATEWTVSPFHKKA